MSDDSFTEKTGDEIPPVGRFYDHAEGEYIWGQNLVYTFYTDDKTGYPLGFRLYEKDAETKIELATQLGEVRLLIAEKVTEDEDKANPVKYLFQITFRRRPLFFTDLLGSWTRYRNRSE